MNWSTYYPAYATVQSAGITPKEGDAKSITKDVEVADIGCGFGGLLVALAPKLPDTLLLGEYLKLLLVQGSNYDQ